VRRREVITVIGGAAAWPFAARAQQPTMPVIGFLNSGAAEALQSLVAAFRQGLSESGYVEGQNLGIEYRWENGDYNKIWESNTAGQTVIIISYRGWRPSWSVAT
jgi:putative ABC transport system substrate-binding protein